MKKTKQLYQNKKHLQQAYSKYGTSRKTADSYGITSNTVLNWMHKLRIPRIPKLHLYNNNTGKGRRCELYIVNHPFFKKHFKDLGEIDDKSKFDGLWYGDRVNIKSCHSKKRLSFRVKQNKHNVAFYICCPYDDDIDPQIPLDIFIIPAKFAPHSTITISLKPTSKYAKFRLSLKRGKEFSIKSEIEYNRQFKKKYKYPKKKITSERILKI